MKIYIAQIAPRVGDLNGNVRLIHEAMVRAEKALCDVVVLPELAVTGYPPEDLLKRPAFMDAVESAVEAVVAASQNACVVFGAPRQLEGTSGNILRNSVILARCGKVIGVYDKQHLPNYGVFDERRYFEPGCGEACVFDVNGWKIGISVCEDLWHDELASKQIRLACDVWLNLNASPFHVGKQSQREALVQRRAQAFSAPLVYVNPVGGQDEIVFDGGSHVADSTGNLLLRAPLFETWQGVVDLGLAGKSSISDVPEPIEQIHRALVMGVADYVLRNGCKQVVIGLSGGIDSALTPKLRRQHIWRKIARDWRLDLIETLGHEISLEELDANIEAMLAGRLRGRVIVNLQVSDP